MISQEHYRTTMGHFCTGVTIVTAATPEGPVGFTCQSFTALSLDPALVLICPGKSSTTWPRIEATGHFCVNVLGEDQEEVCRAFAKSGADKFSGVGWTPTDASASPRIAGALAWVDCSIDSVSDGGDHVIAVGRVLEMGIHEGAPLLFYRGGFGRFAV